MASYDDLASLNYVMLELGRRTNHPDDGSSISTNRIGFYCENISISTSKTTMPFDVPFSGMISGESSTLVIDAGMARKQVTLSGFITDQKISKITAKGSATNKELTSYEIAQLVHSYVDSSFLQEDQNLSKLIVLVPSRVDKNYNYRDAADATADHKDLPLIPFHFANRDLDVPKWAKLYTKGTFVPFGKKENIGSDGEWDGTLVNDNGTSSEIKGIRGFVQDFSTDIVGTSSPFITFTMTFIQASTAMSDFINTSF